MLCLYFSFKTSLTKKKTIYLLGALFLVNEKNKAKNNFLTLCTKELLVACLKKQKQVLDFCCSVNKTIFFKTRNKNQAKKKLKWSFCFLFIFFVFCHSAKTKKNVVLIKWGEQRWGQHTYVFWSWKNFFKLWLLFVLS